MSHEITVRSDGTAEAAFANYPAWHGLGAVIPHLMTSWEALRLANLDWLVKQWRLHCSDGESTFPLEGWYANVREDTHEVLGVVTAKYGLLQNHESFDFMDSLQDDGIVRYEAAFSLRGGKQVCILARVGDTRQEKGDEIRTGDFVKKYALFLSSHDGSMALQCLPTQERTVCANTIRVALSKAAPGEVLSIKHVGDMHAKLDDAKRVLGFANDGHRVMIDEAREMTRYDMDRKDWRAYLDSLAPIPENEDSSKLGRRRQIAAERVRLQMSKNFDATVGSVWDGYNSVTQYVDHQAPRRLTQKAESRFQALMFGEGHKLKARAWDGANSLVESFQAG